MAAGGEQGSVTGPRSLSRIASMLPGPKFKKQNNIPVACYRTAFYLIVEVGVPYFRIALVTIRSSA